MSFPVTVTLAGVDVSAFCFLGEYAPEAEEQPNDWLDEWLETSMKGPGWFDWQVSGFEFALGAGAPVTPSYGQDVRVAIGGVLRFVGVVDKVAGLSTSVRRLTAEPPAVTLKDVMAGTPGVEVGSNEERWLFEIPAPGVTVKAGMELALARYNLNKDERLPDVDWLVDAPEDEPGPVPIRAAHGLTGPEDGVGENDRYYADTSWRSYYLGRRPDGAWYGAGLQNSILLDDPLYPRILQAVEDATGLPVILEWVPDIYQDATDHGTIAGLQRWRVCRLSADGGADNVEPWGDLVDEGPGQPFRMPAGFTLAGTSSAYITQTMAVEYVRLRLGASAQDLLICVATADTPGGTWTLVQRAVAIAEPWEWETRFYAVWWGNPLANRVSGAWVNTAISKVLRDMAVAAGCWLRFTDHEVLATSRETGAAEVAFPSSDLALESEDDEAYGSPAGSLDLLTRTPGDTAGKGLDCPDSKVAALLYWYVQRFSGKVVTAKDVFHLDDLPAGMQLLAGNAEAGYAMGLDWATDGERWRVRRVLEGR